jgi:hypothetical protein
VDGAAALLTEPGDAQRVERREVALREQLKQLADQVVREGLRHVDIPGGGAVVPDGRRRRADAEGRHQLVPEALVVVRPEDHDQVRVERTGERPRLP